MTAPATPPMAGGISTSFERIKGPGAEEHMILNMGPSHPSTHGVLRILLELDGEVIVRAEPDVGYLHRGMEKIAEVYGYNKFIPYYLYPEANYTVSLMQSPKRMKVSVGWNPWIKAQRKHNLAAICERYGGGGHPVVAAISFEPTAVEQARKAAEDIVAELRREEQ